LVRLLVEDDSGQTAQAEALARNAADGGESVFVPLTVMLELEWVLRSRYFYRSQGADFAECLHLATAVSHERLPFFLTFDRQAAKLEGAQLIGA
jgi:predicted nucleic-acid-binding protein